MISTTVACACSPRSCEGFPGYPSFLPHDGNMHVKLISDSKVSIIVNVTVNASLLAVWWTGDLVGIYLSFHHVPPGESSRLLEWRSSEDAGWMCGLSRSLVWTQGLFVKILTEWNFCHMSQQLCVKSETSVFVFYKVVEAFGKIFFSKCLCWVTIFGLFVVQKKRGPLWTEFWSNLTQPSFQILFLAFIKIVMGQTQLRDWRMGVSCKTALLNCQNLSNSAKF